MRVAFVSTDWTTAIHLTAKDVKLLGDGSPRGVSAKDVSTASQRVRGGVEMGEKLESDWLNLGMIPPHKGGSDWFMRDDRGKFLVAFQVTEESFEPFNKEHQKKPDDSAN